LAITARLPWSEITGIPFWALALGFAAVLIGIMALLERWRPWRAELGDNYDGVFAAPEQRTTATEIPHHHARHV
jgi:hypothetical protein